MTSKEALFDLIFEGRRYINDMKLMNLWKIINDDLEVLDILKKNIYVADNTIYATPNELEKDDYKKIKEWYENGKINKI